MHAPAVVRPHAAVERQGNLARIGIGTLKSIVKILGVPWNPEDRE